jgi:hypothetical protein
MSAADLIQLYAPLAGLLVLAFWVGGLSQRVKSLEGAAKDNKEMEKAMIRLVVLVEQLTTRVDVLARELSWLTSIPPDQQRDAPTRQRPSRRRDQSEDPA